MWNFIVKALKEALKEKVTEMTKEEVKEWLDKIGVKVEEVTDDLIAKVEAQKALLDAETRRKTRLFWGPVGLLIGAVVGYGKLFKSTLNNRLHRNLACVIDKSSRSAKLKRAFEELPMEALQNPHL